MRFFVEDSVEDGEAQMNGLQALVYSLNPEEMGEILCEKSSTSAAITIKTRLFDNGKQKKLS